MCWCAVKKLLTHLSLYGDVGAATEKGTFKGLVQKSGIADGGKNGVFGAVIHWGSAAKPLLG